MLNCENLIVTDASFGNCIIDSPFLREYARFYLGWIGLSSFMFFIPVIVYIIVVVIIANHLLSQSRGRN